MAFSDWFTKNKVLIIGLLSAIALPVYDLVSKGVTSTMDIAMAGAVALTAYLSRNLRGQWQTIATAVGTVLATYLTQQSTGHPISGFQLVMQFIVLFLGASAAPAKSIGYEKTSVIMEAKKEGETIVPTAAPPPPPDPTIKYTPSK